MSHEKTASRRRRATAAVLALVAVPAMIGVDRAAAAETTLLAATFDSLPSGPISAENFMKTIGGTNKAASSYDDTSIVAVSGRGKVIRTTLHAGTMQSKPAGNNGITLFIPTSQRLHQACLSYDLRFDGNFDWSLGGKLPGLSGVAPGTAPGTPTGGKGAGDKGWSSRPMWLTPKSYRWAGPVNQGVSYVYHPRQAGDYGDNITWNKSFVAGQWHRVRQCFTMNTPGVANGTLQAWIDGQQVLNNRSFLFRTRADVGITHLLWHVFRGGGTSDWAGSRTDYIDIDNLLMTTLD